MTTHQTQLQHKLVREFHINHSGVDESIPELLSTIQEDINQAIKEGAERFELRYLNMPNDQTNKFGDIGTVRVLAYRTVTKPSEA